MLHAFSPCGCMISLQQVILNHLVNVAATQVQLATVFYYYNCFSVAATEQLVYTLYTKTSICIVIQLQLYQASVCVSPRIYSQLATPCYTVLCSTQLNCAFIVLYRHSVYLNHSIFLSHLPLSQAQISSTLIFIYLAIAIVQLLLFMATYS